MTFPRRINIGARAKARVRAQVKDLLGPYYRDPLSTPPHNIRRGGWKHLGGHKQPLSYPHHRNNREGRLGVYRDEPRTGDETVTGRRVELVLVVAFYEEGL